MHLHNQIPFSAADKALHMTMRGYPRGVEVFLCGIPYPAQRCMESIRKVMILKVP